jgi:hypothetical protein
MDDQDPDEIRRRAYDALAATENVEEQLRERRSRPYRGETEFPAHDTGPAPSPRQAAPAAAAPRDWAAEERWVEGIVERRLAVLVEAFGQVIAHERATTREAISELRRVLAQGEHEGLSQGLARIEQMLSRLDYSGVVLADRAAPSDLPN